MRKLRLSRPAREFILSEIRYFKKYSQSAAARFRADMHEGLRKLPTYPRSGRPDDAYPVAGVRRAVIAGYVVHYAIAVDAVDILYIRHGRQSEPWVEVDDDQDFEL